MSTTVLFRKHFGGQAAVNLDHPNVEKFFDELNKECLLEDQQKAKLKCQVYRRVNDVRRILEFSDEFFSWTPLHSLRALDVVFYCGALLLVTEDAHRSLADKDVYIARCLFVTGNPDMLDYDYFKAVPHYNYLVVNQLTSLR